MRLERSDVEVEDLDDGSYAVKLRRPIRDEEVRKVAAELVRHLLGEVAKDRGELAPRDEEVTHRGRRSHHAHDRGDLLEG